MPLRDSSDSYAGGRLFVPRTSKPRASARLATCSPMKPAPKMSSVPIAEGDDVAAAIDTTWRPKARRGATPRHLISWMKRGSDEGFSGYGGRPRAWNTRTYERATHMFACVHWQQ